MHDHSHDVPDAEPFEDAPISRRQFVKLSAATGGVLALPGQATASVDSAVFDAEYQYLLNHTPDDFLVPTLIELSDPLGLQAFEALSIGQSIHTTTTPKPAVYAQLTTVQAEQVAELPTAEELSYSPGSNPFWRLDYYPLGVFPETSRSVDFIDYEQMISGMEHLEAEHPEMLKFYALADADNPHDVQFGRSPGHDNLLTDRHDPKDLHVAELTVPPAGFDTVEEFRDTEAFAERQKVMFEASIHGLERAGPEACYRFIERILTGREVEMERLLEECVLIILSVNPDGWVARDPQYGSGWQATGPNTRIPAAPLHERGNAEVFDTNRQYPTIGWIDPNHHPGEPDTDRWATDNPHEIIDKVPDAMGAVEHFRQYENLTHGADLHAMLNNSAFILGLINQIEFTQDEFHDLYEMNLVLEASLEEQLDTWEALADIQEAVTGDFNLDAGFPVLPETAYDFSTIWDTIGYTITGGMIGFMGADEERGGLDMTTMAFEMAYSHMIGGNVYNPALADLWVTGYMEAMRTMTDYALRDVESAVMTRDGESTTVAFVHSDTLTRASDDLEFLQGDGTVDPDSTVLTSTQQETSIAPGVTETMTVDLDETVHTLSIHPHAEHALFDVVLRNPAGEVVRSYRPSETGGAAHHDYESFVIKNAQPGEWTVGFESLMAEEVAEAAVDVAMLQTDLEHPDPRAALGFEQESYEVTPEAFFADFENDNDLVDVVELDVADVASGVADDIDHLVIIHDDGAENDDYVAAIDEFVDRGGNLVLTDTGLFLLERMATAPGVEDGDVETRTFGVANLEEKHTDHPLLTDTRDIQRMPYKIAPLGIPYANDAPMSLVDTDAFEASGGTVAGETSGMVGCGSIFTDDENWQGIHVLGGLLPPASQTELHPFGLKNYVLAYFGLTIFTNALGVEQQRFVDGELVRTVGDVDQTPIVGDTPDDVIDLTASGVRDVDSSTYTGGQTARVVVTLEELDTDAETVEVFDEFPEEWTLLDGFGDGTEVEAGRVSLGTVDADDFDGRTFTYFLEAPDELADTNTYDLGPAEAVVELDDDTVSDEFTEAETVLVVGISTSI